MAGEIIRPSALPDRPNPVASEKVPTDNGVTVGGTTWEAGVAAGRPLASQVEAEGGANASKAMTPLTTKQAIDAQVPTKIAAAITALNLGSASQADTGDFATAEQGTKADTAVQTVVAGTNVSVDASDPQNPVISAIGGEGGFESLQWTEANYHPPVGPAAIRTDGYATAGDGGGALYRMVGSEPAHAGKLSITLADAITVVWYEIAEGGTVNLKQFGCKCDGVADDTASFQSCVDYAAPRYFKVVIPVGTTRITAKISHIEHMHIVGERQAPYEDPPSEYYRKGSVIASEVAFDYALQFGRPPGGYGIGGQYEGFKVIGVDGPDGLGKTNGLGMKLENGGWDLKISDLVIQSFKKGGMTFAYMQDGLIEALTILDCGTKNVNPSLVITHSSPTATANLLTFNRLRIEKTEYMALVTESSIVIEFNNAHLEAGEYDASSGIGGDINRYTPYTTFRVVQSQNVRFNGGAFIPNSVEYGASEGGVPESAVEHAMAFDACRGCSITNMNFLRYGTGRTMRALLIGTGSSGCEVSGCFFEVLNTDDYSIIVNGTHFHDNSLQFEASGNTTFYGVRCGTSMVDGNTLLADNGSDPNKTVGYLFFGEATAGNYLGFNVASIGKAYKNHNAGWTAKGYEPRTTADISGGSSLNLEFYDLNTQFTFSSATTLGPISNALVFQEMDFRNYAGAAITINNGDGTVLRGATNASLPPGYGLKLQQHPATGGVYEVSRNF